MSRNWFPVKLIIICIIAALCSGCLMWRLYHDISDGMENGTNIDNGADGDVVDDDNVYDITQFGVRGNVKQCQAAAINAAIFKVSKQGGGTVFFPEGKYYIGPGKYITLQPGVNLRGAGMGKTIIWGEYDADYLIKAKSAQLNVTISHLTLENPVRLILMETVSEISFHQVEFRKGMVRFEKNSSHIEIDHCRFIENTGKGAYASDVCSYVRLTYNEVINPTEGGFNLSRHQNSYVAYNYIYSDTNIDSGYAGIRLPNSAHNNVVEHNEIIRMGRGIFVLSGSENNLVQHNTVEKATSQGIFVESSNNIVRGNTIQDAGAEAIYVNDSSSSKAHHNMIEANHVFDTYRIVNPDPKRQVIGLRIYGQGNTVRDNTVDGAFGRLFKNISAGNNDEGNQYVK